MSSTKKRKEHLLFFLLALLALSIAANYLPEHLTTPAPAPSVKTEPPQPDAKDELPLLGKLGRKPVLFDQVHRNIFVFSGQDADEPTALEESVPEETETMATETAPEDSTRPDISFVGYYHEKGPSGAVFASLLIGNRIYVGGTGDVIEQSYKILQISSDHVVVQQINGSGVLSLALGKNAAPTAPQNKVTKPKSH